MFFKQPRLHKLTCGDLQRALSEQSRPVPFRALEKRIAFDAALLPVAVDAAVPADAASEPVAAPLPDAGSAAEAIAHLIEAGSAAASDVMSLLATPTDTPRAEILFVDPTVDGLATLLSGIDARIEVVILDPTRDGIDQIAGSLAGREGIDAIHIISHGNEARLQIGTADLNLTSIGDRYAQDLAAIAGCLSADADILIYGCNFGQGADGRQAMGALSQATGADVAASTDLTGAADRSGDWVLESATGAIDTRTIEAASWDGLLAAGDWAISGSTSVTEGANAVYTLTLGGTLTSGQVASINLALTDTTTSSADHAAFVTAVQNAIVGRGDLTFNGTKLTYTAPNYSSTGIVAGSNFYDIATTGTAVSGMTDDSATAVALPFAFNFYGSNYSSVYVGSNGTLNFNASSVVYNNTTLSGTTFGAGNPGICLFWDDLNPAVATATTKHVLTQTIGAVGSRQFIVQYQDIALYGQSYPAVGTGTFQVVLNEGTGVVEMRYKDVVFTNTTTSPNDYAASASIGLTSGGTSYVQVSANTANTSLTNSHITFAPTTTATMAPLTITLATVNDTAVENNETMTIALTSPVGSTISTGASLVTTIIDNDNVAPVLDLDANNSSGAGGTGYSTTYTENGTAVAIGDIDVRITDTNDTTLTGATVTLTNSQAGDVLAAGALPAGITASSYDSATGILTLSGTASLANYQSAIRAITFASTADGLVTTARTVTVVVSDGRPSNALSAAATATITIAALNDAPVNTIPASFATDEDIAITLNGLSISDADAASGAMTVTLSVTSGTLNAVTGGGVTVTGGGTASLTLTGSLSALNSYLAGASAPVFTPASNASGTVTLTMTTSDGGNTGGGGVRTDSDTSVITVTAVNDAPVLANGAAQTFTENGTAVAIAPALTLSDADHATFASATVSIANFVSGQDALAFVNVGGMGNIAGAFNATTGVLTLTSAGGTATTAQWQAALRAVTYANTSNMPDATTRTINVAISDGLDSASLTSTVAVIPVNEAPVNTLAAGYTMSEASTLAITGLSVADIDAGSASVSVTLDVTTGTLTALAGGGVSVAGSGTASLTLTGTLASLNAYLGSGAAPVFTPPVDATGSVTLTMTTSDGGNTGTGGVLTDTDTRTITISPVNDAPINTMPVSFTTSEDTALVLTGLALADVDASSGALSITLNVTSGRLNATAGGGVSVSGSGSATLVLSGTLSNLNAYLGSGSAPVFTPAANASGTVTLTMTSSDGGNTGSGGTLSDSDTRAITVSAVNDAPVITLPATIAGIEDTALTIPGGAGGIVITDVDAASRSISVTLSVPAGTGSLAWTSTAFIGAVGSGSTSITLSGQVSAINAAIAAGKLVFTPTQDQTASVTLSLLVNDNGNTGSGGALTGTGSTLLTFSPVNDAPAAGALSSRMAVDGASASFSVAAAFSDADAGDTLTFTAVNLPAGLSISAAGVISGTISPTASSGGTGGVYTVTVRGTDGAGDYAEASFTYTVTNPAPVARNDSFTTSEDIALTTGNLLASNGLGADSDPDGDALSVDTTAVSGPAHGTLVLNADGSFSYTPDAQFNGADSFTYRLLDANGASATAVVTITVSAVNDAPVSTALGDRSAVDSASVSFSIAASFSDVDSGDTLSYSASGLPAGLSINAATGVISGTLSTHASQGGTGGVYTVQVTATDAGGLTTSRTFAYTISNPAPVASADTFTVAEDGSLSGNLLASNGAGADSDSDGDTLSIETTPVSGPGKGAVTLNANGTFTYTPNANATGTDTFTYRLVDSDGATSTATVTITISAVNDAPTATALADRTGVDGGSVSFALGSAFLDLDGDALNFSATGLPSGLGINPTTGTISGTIGGHASQGGSAGVYSVTVTASDGNGGSVSRSFNYTITNPGPVANADSVTGSEDQAGGITGTVLTNDTDPDGDALTASTTLVSQPAHGTVSLSSTGAFVYTPASNYNGNDSFRYTVLDADGGSAVATVTLTITASNDAPVLTGTASNQNSLDGQVVSLNLAPFFSDTDLLDTASSETLSYVASGLPPGLSINASGLITGTIDPGASGATGAFTYTVSVQARDLAGQLSPALSFTWRIVNLPPGAVDDAITIAEDAPAAGYVDINVRANDTDSDGDTLTIVAGSVSAGHGTVSIVGGQIRYQPTANYHGTDTILYSVDDGNGGLSTAQVVVTITAANDAPTSATVPPQRNNDGQAVSFDVSTFFSDVDKSDPGSTETLSFSVTGLPPGLSIDSATGIISGTLASTASLGGTGGVYTVEVTAQDAAGLTTAQSFTWTAQNTEPHAGDDTASVNEDGSTGIAVLLNDTDPNLDPLIVLSASAGHGTVTINADNTLTYTPAANFNGTDTISYRITDGKGSFATGVVQVTVAAVNDAPTSPAAALANASSTDGDAVAFALGAFFDDIDRRDAGSTETLTFSASGLPAGVSINAATGEITGTIGTSASGASGSTSYTVSVTATDSASATVTRSFSWLVVNPAPTARNDTATTNEDTVVMIDAVGGTTVGATADTDPDGDALAITAVSAANGTVSVVSGQIRYTPNAHFHGTDTVVYTVSDGNGGYSTASVQVTVSALNDAPTTTGIAARTSLDGDAISFNAATAFDDVDLRDVGSTETLTYAVIGTLPTGLSLDTSTGLITGTIDTGASGASGSRTFSFQIRATDAANAFATASVDWTVNNRPPVASADAATGSEDTLIVGSVLGNDSDPDSDTLSVDTTPVTGPAHGTLVLLAGGSFEYQPAANFNGTDSFTYRLRDANGGTATATVNLTVAAINDAPVAGADSASVNEDGTVTITVLGNDTDVDGDNLAVTSASAAHGAVTINADGTLTYVPHADFVGTDTLSYAISDGHGGTSTATVTITVNPANDAPVATTDVAGTSEDSAVTIDVRANDRDIDGDTLSIVSTGIGAPTALNGTVSVTADGRILYTPNANFNGTDTVTYAITDGQGGTATTTVTITVAAVNDAPVATALTGRAANDQDAVSFSVASAFSDVDAGDTLTFSASGLPAGLAINASTGLITGTVDRHASTGGTGGVYTVEVTVHDAAGASVSRSFSYTISNPAPLAVADSASGNEDDTMSGNVLGNDSDPDGDALVVGTTPVVAPLHGTLTLASNGSFTYVPAGNYFGTDSFTYQVTDADGAARQATVSLTVNAVNDAPAATGIAAQAGVDGTTVSLDVSSHFSDIEGNALSYSASGLPAGLTLHPTTGVISGSISNAASAGGPDATGVYYVTITASDGLGGTASVSFSYAITNPAPVAVADTSSGAEDQTQSGMLLANDSDGDLDALVVDTTPVTNPAHGTVTLLANGSFTYQPDANFFGIDSFSYRVTDAQGASSTATVSVTVTPVNDAPVANTDSVSTSEDTPVAVVALLNDTDVDNDTLTITSAAASHGTVTIGANGQLLYTPFANTFGPDTITYAISDGNGGTASSTVAVTVSSVNDAPVAVADTVTTTEDMPVTLDVRVNDTDVESNGLTVTGATASHGSVVIEADGRLTFTPDVNYNGPATITYTISDGNGGTSTATVAVTVTSANDAPVATADSASTAEDTPVVVTVLANDTDVDANPLTVTSASAVHGSVTINADGTLTYLPHADYNGPDTISYTISDGQGGVANSTVALTVAAVNDAPRAGGPLANLTGLDGQTLAGVSVASGFTDVEGNSLTYSATGLPSGLTINAASGVISGTLASNASQGGSAGAHVVQVTAADGNGGTLTRSFTYTVANPGPVARTDVFGVAEDTALTRALLTNDSDPDGDALHVETTPVSGPSHGTLTIQANGTFTYTPALDFNGSDSFSYRLVDADGATAVAVVQLTVDAVNDPPVAAPISDRSGIDGQAVALNFSVYFSDPESDPLTFTATGLPPGLSINAATGTISGTIGLSASTGGASANGDYAVLLSASDGNGGSVSKLFHWTIANPGPTAVNDTGVTSEDTPLDIAVLSNDQDPDGDSLQVVSATAGHGAVTINADGSLHYVPNANFHGSDTILYTIRDQDGAQSTAALLITVEPINDAPAVSAMADLDDVDGTSVTQDFGPHFSDVDGDTLTFSASNLPDGLSIDPATGIVSGTLTASASLAGPYAVTIRATDTDGATGSLSFTWTIANLAPVAVNDTAPVLEDGTVTIDVLSNDYDPDGDTPQLVSNSVTAAHGTVSVNANGSLTYQPNANFNGTDTIIYRIGDGSGAFSTATVTVSVTPVNDAPQSLAIPDVYAADAQTLDLPVGPFFSDIDGDGLTYSASGLPAGLTINGSTGLIAGTIAANASVLGPYSVTVTAVDGLSEATARTFSIIVSNPLPLASNDTLAVNEDTAGSVSVLANDSDPDADALTVVSASAAHGTVTIQAGGVLNYLPDANFNGTDAILYRISDGQGGYAMASVAVTVAPVNDAPVVTHLDVTTPEDTARTIAASALLSDVEQDVLTITGASAVHGTVVIGTDNTLTYTPDADYNGTDTLTYDVSDGQGGLTTATITVTVTPRNDAPVAVSDTLVLGEDQTRQVQVLGNDSDIDLDPLTAVSASALHGTVTLLADGWLHYAPDASYNGSDTIQYTISDGHGGTAVSTVAVTVMPANDAPVARDDTATTVGDRPVRIAALVNDSDIDGDSLSLSGATAANGRVTSLAGGVLTYVARRGFSGTDTITYTISDGAGGSATATVRVDVALAANDRLTVDEDTAGGIAVLGEPAIRDADGLVVVSVTAAHGTVTVLPGGLLHYMPAAHYHGTDVISYSTRDALGRTADGRVDVTVRPVNDAPFAVDDGATTLGDTPVSIAVLANDSDLDGDRVHVVSASAPNGQVTIQADGTLLFVANRGFSGMETITYVIGDGAGGLATATVRVWVVPEPAPATDIAVAPVALPAGTDSPARPTQIATEGVVGDTIRTQNGETSGLPSITSGPVVLTVVNGASSLQGLGDLQVRSGIVGQAIALPVQRTFTIAMELAVQGTGGLWDTEPLKGASLSGAPLVVGGTEGGGTRVHLETIMRDTTLMLEINELGSETSRQRISHITLTLADGRPLPPWLQQVHSGSYVGTTPADVEHVRLKLHTHLIDGRVITRDFDLNAQSGEVTWLSEASRQAQAPTFSQQLQNISPATSGVDFQFLFGD